jgi:hypothetical protein
VFHHIVASSAENTGAFNTGFETVSLHRATTRSRLFLQNSRNPMKAAFGQGPHLRHALATSQVRSQKSEVRSQKSEVELNSRDEGFVIKRDE